VPARDNDGMAGPVTEVCTREPVAGCQRAVQYPGHHRGTHIGSVDDVQNGVVPVHTLGVEQTGTNRGAQALFPVGRGDRNDTRWGRNLCGAENQNDFGATTVAQRADRGLKPALDQYLWLAVPPAGAGGQQDADSAWRRITRPR